MQPRPPPTPKREQAPALQSTSDRRLPALALAALGVVFGDIGTSPLYALHVCFKSGDALPATEANVLGVLSLVFADPRSPGQPAIRLRTHLSYNQSLDMADLMLAGLFLATGLDELVFGTLNPRDRARLADQFRRNLPDQLNQLINGARGAATVGV